MAKEYNINVTGLMSKDFPVLANSKKEAEILAKRILTNTNLVDFNMCDFNHCADMMFLPFYLDLLLKNFAQSIKTNKQE